LNEPPFGGAAKDQRIDVNQAVFRWSDAQVPDPGRAMVFPPNCCGFGRRTSSPRISLSPSSSACSTFHGTLPDSCLRILQSAPQQ
jgi:hypothetical protein